MKKALYWTGLLFLILFFRSYGKEISLFKEVSINPEEEKIFDIELPEKKENDEILLEFKARIDSSDFSRGENVMKVYLNDKEIDLKYLINKTGNIGSIVGWGYPTYIRFNKGYFLFKSPDFTPFSDTNPWKTVNTDQYLFQFKITDFVEKGNNVLKIKHTYSNVKEKIVVAEGKILIRDKKKEKIEEKELKYISPKKIDRIPINLEITKGGAIKVKLKNLENIIVSLYSIEGGGWAEFEKEESPNFKKIEIKKIEKGYEIKGESRDFIVERKVEAKNLCVEVREKIKNKKNEILPVKHKHQFELMDVEKKYLGGALIEAQNATRPDSANPTVICLNKNGTIGLIALDDIFRVHFLGFVKEGVYGIADNELVIMPESEVSIKWAVFLSEESDYYSIINLMRNYLGVNFKIEGPMAFIHPRNPGTKWKTYPRELPGLGTSIEDLRSYLKNKSVKFAISSTGEAGKWNEYKGEVPMGTAFQKVVDTNRYKNFFNNLKTAIPEIKTGIYFHCFLDNAEEAPEKFKDSRVIKENGTHAEYPYGRKRKIPLLLYFPTFENSFGKEIGKNVEIILNEIKADGVYWDEFEFSGYRYHYGEPHDKVSADIHWNTNKIIRLKSSLILLSQPWRVKLVEEIGQKGKFMIFNFAPNTETSMEISKKYKIPRFVETGGTSGPCLATHLYTPIALGNHMFELTEEDCYFWMLEVLNYGCLYYWYVDGIWADYPTLTEYMYPITPVEIGEGYIIGKERILTRRSGYFSFGDLSGGEVHFFGKDGREIKKKYGTIIKDGKKYYRIILDEMESCVIVKKIKKQMIKK